ncbi:hypothetical protein [Actinomyces provencensis]|uniref:hypothetical protein n=1 Tax=Actinomyces provencensis TaxID=1720198 RepID=UPI00096A8C1C|nr:hypothetical protein [Actinomyces provencensis]
MRTEVRSVPGSRSVLFGFLDLSALLVGVGTLPRRGQARAEGPRLPFNPECSDGGEDDGADQV